MVQSVRWRWSTAKVMTLTPGRSVPDGIGVSTMRRVLAGSQRLVDDPPVVDRDAEKRVLGRDVDGAVESDGQRCGARRLFRSERETPGAPSGFPFEAESRRGQEVSGRSCPLSGVATFGPLRRGLALVDGPVDG